MVKAVIAFLLGVVLLQFQARLPDPAWLWVFPLLGLAAWRWPVLHTLWWLAAGLGWAWLQGHLLLAQALPAALEGRDLVIEGVVASLVEQDPRRSRFVFTVEEAHDQGRLVEVPGRVRLNWYRAPVVPRAGERWRLKVRLKRPHGFMNPGGFDYEAWLFQRRIRALGYVRKSTDNQRLRPASAWSLNGWRQGLRERLAQQLDQAPFRGVLTALSLGERSGITAGQWQVLRDTGTTHLMAISGLHVGLVAGFAFLLGRWLWGRSAWLCLRWPKQQAAALLALIAALAYALMAGFSIPTQRALIMLGVWVLAGLWRRNPAPAEILAAALLLVLLRDPLAVLAAGFWLSFAAVAVILYVHAGYRGGAGPWWRWGRIHVLIALGLLPLTALFFQQQSLVSPLANLLAVPWVSLLVTPLTLAGSLLSLLWPAAGGLLLNLADQAMQWLWQALAMLASWPFARLELPVAGAASLFLALAGVAVLLLPRGLPGRWLGGVMLLPLLFPRSPRPEPGEAWFTLLDVGQGLAAVVRTERRVLVFDTGPRFSAGFDTGAAVLVPFLRRQGLSRLDMLVISHADNDHIGGAESLLRALPARRVLSSRPDRLPGHPAEACRQGMQWQWDGVDFAFLHPGGKAAGRAGNDASCVLRVRAGGKTLLLPGDIEAGAERQLLARYAGRLRADILVAPHHGSRTSSSPAFARAVAPRHVLFAVGYRNRYRFPHADVSGRYRRLHALAWDSARHGALLFRLEPGRPLAAPVAWRVQAARYWHNRTD